MHGLSGDWRNAGEICNAGITIFSQIGNLELETFFRLTYAMVGNFLLSLFSVGIFLLFSILQKFLTFRTCLYFSKWFLISCFCAKQTFSSFLCFNDLYTFAMDEIIDERLQLMV